MNVEEEKYLMLTLLLGRCIYLNTTISLIENEINAGFKCNTLTQMHIAHTNMHSHLWARENPSAHTLATLHNAR